MKKIFVLVFLTILILLSESVFASVQEASTLDPVCGNSLVETGEQCDGPDLGGASCANQGFSSGTLSCNSNCTFYTSACTSGGGGGGSGGGGSILNPSIKVPIGEKEKILKMADFNTDQGINIIDLSILLFYYNQTGANIVQYDLNGDKIIDIIDISILFYYWDIT